MYGCLTFLFFGLFFIVIASVLGAFRLLFGLKRSARRFANSMKGTTSQAPPEEEAAPRSPRKRKGKFFEKDEGVYVDFEEIR